MTTSIDQLSDRPMPTIAPNVVRTYVEEVIGPHSRTWYALGNMLLRRIGEEEIDDEPQSINPMGYLSLVDELIADIREGEDRRFGDPIPPEVADSIAAPPDAQRDFLVAIAGQIGGPEFGEQVKAWDAVVAVRQTPEAA